MAGVQDATGDRPYRIEQIVTNDDCTSDDETHALSKELRASQDDHAGTDGPYHLHHNADAPIELLDSPRRKAPRSGNDEPLDANEPDTALEQERAQRRPRPARRHQAGARARQKHKHRRAEV